MTSHFLLCKSGIANDANANGDSLMNNFNVFLSVGFQPKRFMADMTQKRHVSFMCCCVLEITLKWAKTYFSIRTEKLHSIEAKKILKKFGK